LGNEQLKLFLIMIVWMESVENLKMSAKKELLVKCLILKPIIIGVVADLAEVEQRSVAILKKVLNVANQKEVVKEVKPADHHPLLIPIVALFGRGDVQQKILTPSNFAKLIAYNGFLSFMVVGKISHPSNYFGAPPRSRTIWCQAL